MSNNIKISIITINKNNAKGLEKTIISVTNQTHKYIEYVVIDGNSTDKSLDVINKYTNSISISISEQDNGIYDAMNKGLELCTGEYILFLNSGDVLYNNQTIENVIQYLDNDFDFIYGNLSIIKDNRIVELKSPKEIYYFESYQHNIPPHPVCFIKKSLYNKFNGFDTSYKIVSDVVTISKILSDKKIRYKYVDSIITVFDTNGVSSNINNQELIFKERERFLSINFPEYLDAFYNINKKSSFKMAFHKFYNFIIRLK
jgi:glycosyltransferase involved in cell wall biosynthesis